MKAIHHSNGNPNDNHIENLEIKEAASESVKVETQKTRPASSFTKGPCRIFGTNKTAIESTDGTLIANAAGRTLHERQANAELIAEAFDVATETGLTPRQLCDEMFVWRLMALETAQAVVALGQGFGQLTHVIAAAEVVIRKADSVPSDQENVIDDSQ